MKKIIMVLLTVGVLIATSCQDFLEQQNPNKVESEFYFTDEISL